VYPSARHDRFAHSLGTYFLAKTAANAIMSNAMNLGSNEISHELRELAFNFEMAALLHDIGHSPMSHTLEKYFEQSEDIDSMLTDRIQNPAFSSDFAKAEKNAHEVVSSIIVFDCFAEALQTICKSSSRGFSDNLEFIVRCITGTLYHDGSDIGFKNAFIRLLNSQAIDVDKLDYIKRDSIVSGYDNISIDTYRLLNSLTAVDFTADKSFTLAFSKSALSVVQNVVECRNMLYTWVYGHHKVVYENDYLLSTAVRKVIQADSESEGKTYEEKLAEVFTINAIKNNLICDDDIWVMLKKHLKIPEVAELLDRRTHKTAVWKIRAEFDLLFPRNEETLSIGDFDVKLFTKTIENGKEDYTKFLQYIDKKFSAEGGCSVAIFIKPKIKAKIIQKNDVYIAINNRLYPYTSIKSIADKSRDTDFVYVYIDANTLNEFYHKLLVNDKPEFTRVLVEHIKSYEKFFMRLE
jgi:hypothetical protein